MQLIKWNPARDFFSLSHNINNLLDDFFYPSRKTLGDRSQWNWNPAVDIYEDENHIVVKAEIPGTKKESITVDVKDRMLTLSGERTEEKDVNEERYFRKERIYGRFERKFTLPANVNTEDIKAEYKEGVLEVVVPKPEALKPKQITVH